MNENGLGNLFLRHLVMAVSWGIIFLVVFCIGAIGIKQQVKKGVQYAVTQSMQEAAQLAYSYNVVVPVKKNIKEGIEFVAKTAKKEIEAILSDPQLKQDVKEALEFSGEKLKE